MALLRFGLALVVGLIVGWTAATELVPKPDREAAIEAIDAAIASVVSQPDQCASGRAQAMKAPMAAVAVLKELRVALLDEKVDPSSVKARVDELGKTNLPPAARSIVGALAKNSLDRG